MTRFNSSAVRSSVTAAAALAVISMLAWSFEAYRTYLWERGQGTAVAAYLAEDGEAANG